MPDFRYNRPETMDSEDYFEFKSGHYDLEFIACDAAEDYHYHHDGWESTWPINIRIMDSCGHLLGTFDVDRETMPFFRARKTKESE